MLINNLATSLASSGGVTETGELIADDRGDDHGGQIKPSNQPTFLTVNSLLIKVHQTDPGSKKHNFQMFYLFIYLFCKFQTVFAPGCSPGKHLLSCYHGDANVAYV